MTEYNTAALYETYQNNEQEHQLGNDRLKDFVYDSLVSGATFQESIANIQRTLTEMGDLFKEFHNIPDKDVLAIVRRNLSGRQVPTSVINGGGGHQNRMANRRECLKIYGQMTPIFVPRTSEELNNILPPIAYQTPTSDVNQINDDYDINFDYSSYDWKHIDELMSDVMKHSYSKNSLKLGEYGARLYADFYRY